MLIRRRHLLGAAGGLAASGAAVSAYAVGIEPGWRIDVVEYDLQLPGWRGRRPLTLVLLADIHCCRPFMPLARVERIVAVANDLGADAAVLLGDYVGSHRLRLAPIPAGDWARALAGLRTPLGTHAVLGNHDWWEDGLRWRQHVTGLPEAARALSEAGIALLENQGRALEAHGAPFWLLGLGDQWAFGMGRGTDDLAATVAPARRDAAPAILLAHEPDIFPRVPDRVALTLSGHTHGGQVRLFGWSPAVPSAFGDRYIHGHYTEGGRQLVVSAGLGTSVAPVRFGVPPEIVLLRLHSAAGV